VEFKLHPRRRSDDIEVLRQEHAELFAPALRVWLWLESRRLDCFFSSARVYARNNVRKSFETSALRNWLLNLRTFGPRAVLSTMALRYPRERLLNTLPLLLWDECLEDAEVVRHLQTQLETEATGWDGWLRAYKAIWQKYG